MTTFRHDAGPDLSRSFNSQENGSSPRTQELLGRISDGIRGNKILEGENERLEAENQILREQNEELMETKTSLRRGLDDLGRVVEDMGQKSGRPKESIDKMRQPTAATNQDSGWFPRNLFRNTGNSQVSRDTGVNALLTENTKCKKRIQELTAENREMSQTVAEQASQIRKQRAEFAQELDDLRDKAFAKGVKLSDTEIQTKWKMLGFSIRQFVSEYFPEPLDGHTAHLLAQKRLFTWLPQPAMTLQAPMLYQVTLESWIWHFLCFRIFDSHSSFWAGEVGKAFRIQCDQFRETIANIHSPTSRDAAAEKFHDWRVRSADLISALSNHDEASSTALLVREMVALLELAIPSTYFTRSDALPGMQQDLLDIVQNAAHLAGIFRASKADFQVFITRIKLPLVTPPSFGFPFDAETMELFKDVPLVTMEGTMPVVDLVVSPGILKTGSADGTNYNSDRVLVKLQTLYNLRPVLELLHYDGTQQQVHRGGQEAPMSAEDGYTMKEEQSAEAGAGVIVVKQELEG
ncbi:uncharacterized protein B0H64DRAFT_443651 [Chaetomium fimeti]|uniref:Uncharacterized protein n=1 Tax=Chaetomium fimeti TaxID=1854472 RepID=A0AAE0HDY3_9PEZI|nr:hypothetical protein B0H64DRAFT_443651 [Chaetomium fimeti]